MTRNSFRRLFIHSKEVYAEVNAQLYRLPNPTPEGRTYSPVRVEEAVRTLGEIDTSRWVRTEEPSWTETETEK